MAPPLSTTGRTSREAVEDEYFTPLASAKYMMLTTFKRDGSPVSTPVHVVVDGDRAYFRTCIRSGKWQRLRHTDWVQVAPCTLLGLCRYGPTLGAVPRLRVGEEASRPAAKLALKYPVQRGFLSTFLYRLKRWPAVYYELQAHEPPEVQADGSADELGKYSP